VQINEYLTFLLANKLIIRDEMTHTYAPSERGIHFLRVFDEMDRLSALDEPITIKVGK
jgi:predicted transcriptional regulator